ncbi:Hypothetical protein R9X50_00573200 [Acrodontium crateriforme]|uniref:NF-kappa-B inhibitor-like protein 1 n=1 Tax=Acrodontium crateriforme TaxID=150365 RepID=A0AAQ3R9C5_9PEZI|nr:Hypothetical protein R9X50_00573200 [Acrodontium crateriforme]
MPSMEETKRRVKESLEKQSTGPDHDDILKSLQDEIDKHNAVKDDIQRSMRTNKSEHDDRSRESSAPSMRFRFKSGTSDPTKRMHRPRHGSHKHREKRRRTRNESTDNKEGSHPFPREPTNLDRPDLNSTDAFRESLFDALADDEGAQYWESVYNQPIHVYPRPTIQTAKGELEEMNDEEYAAYVKTKMWEKKNPHIVLERERSERRRKEQEEEKTKEREQFVRMKERAAWERAQRGDRRERRRSNDDKHEHIFTGQANNMSEGRKSNSEEQAAAWSRYLEAWGQLQQELLSEHDSPTTGPAASQRIPWPVFAAKQVLKPNVEEFMRNPPLDEERSLLTVLKAERVRWHPDKVQQRFRGTVDEGTMKLVTGVFQVIDSLFEEERKRISLTV